MSRSGYVDDMGDQWAMIRYRGAVSSAIRGRRGQAFLREMLAALDAMPEKRLISGALVFDGQPEIPWDVRPHEDVIIGGDMLVTGWGETVRVGDVCAMGCLGRARGTKMDNIDAHEPAHVSALFGIAEALAREVAYINDETGGASPELRFERVRKWVVENLREDGDETRP